MNNFIYIPKKQVNYNRIFPAITKPLIICSEGTIRRGYLDIILKILVSQDVIVWSGVQNYLSIEQIQAGYDSVNKEFKEIDYILAIGGGSAIDTAKIFNALASSRIKNLESLLKNQNLINESDLKKIIAIPTTTGSGSESTQFATVWDHKNLRKHSIESQGLLPHKVLFVEKFICSFLTPDAHYAKLDACAHAIESILSKDFTKASLEYATQSLLRGLRRFEKNESTGSSHRNEDLFLSSYYAGKAIAITKTNIAHAISYPFTLEYGVPHGLASGFTLESIWLKYGTRIKLPNDIHNLIDETIKEIGTLRLSYQITNYVDYKKLKKNKKLFTNIKSEERINKFLFDVDTDQIEELIINSFSK
jgi:alcohol dehydrogenase class IV